MKSAILRSFPPKCIKLTDKGTSTTNFDSIVRFSFPINDIENRLISSWMFSWHLHMLKLENHQNRAFHQKMLFFLIERDAPYSLLYSPLSNFIRKISFMRLLRYWTRLSVIWDHPAHCSEVWFRNSNFSGTRTIQFNDQKCFSATFHCFHTAGLLRKWNLKKWSAPHGST